MRMWPGYRNYPGRGRTRDCTRPVIEIGARKRAVNHRRDLTQFFIPSLIINDILSVQSDVLLILILWAAVLSTDQTDIGQY